MAAIRETRGQAEAEYRHKLSDELAKAEQKANGLTQDLIKAEQKTRLQLLTAPVDGMVQQLGIHTVGGVVTPAQSLLVIVPSDSRAGTGLVIVDDQGYIFTPSALYLEAEQRGIEAPNALRLSRDQATEAQARLSPAAKAIAVAPANTAEERERLKEQAVELNSTPVDEAKVGEISERLKEAPPVSFDVARQVRIFESYLQYVDLRLTGAAIHRHRISIPRRIQNLGSDEKVPECLRTTFDLIERESELSPKPIEDELNEIRRNLTRPLGKEHGRVILKSRKPLLENRLMRLSKTRKLSR
jgi:hypothetical protein